ncbi:glycosyltransferase family 4 protein [Zunongwangia sp.]|uniref:glycosyltransferase family 4 protein n=1 Tax=Zunongwangia sp. TaxID=1965325 RepID=UPI003AA9B679
MRVLQIIDSLDAGGAERMSVNLFNSLNQERKVISFLVVTRKEGILKEDISIYSNYLFLDRKNTWDIRAFSKLIKFTRLNKISHIHAHGSSYFIASLLKMVIPKLVLIWHDHYGNSEFLENRPHKFILKICSNFFNGIIAVNNKLKEWGERELFSKHVAQINNFVELRNLGESNLLLKGNEKEKIICIANIRPQKNHLFLLQAFDKLKNRYNVSLHLFGKTFNTIYNAEVLALINNTNHVYFYNSQVITKSILKQATIGLLVSKSEGLPLALLEYGMAGLPVICTDVGDCRKVIGSYGKLIESNDEKSLLESINYYVNNEEARKKNARLLQERIRSKFGSEEIINQILKFYKACK